ncbi:MAG: hypothetical protein F2840_17955 [Actinobacteria bacterium]|nr:hypothetical protein [Actinomycetota bacterium]
MRNRINAKRSSTQPADIADKAAGRSTLFTGRYEDADYNGHDNGDDNPGDAEPHTRERHTPVAGFAVLDALEAEEPKDDGKAGPDCGERRPDAKKQGSEERKKSTDEANDSKKQGSDAEPILLAGVMTAAIAHVSSNVGQLNRLTQSVSQLCHEMTAPYLNSGEPHRSRRIHKSVNVQTRTSFLMHWTSRTPRIRIVAGNDSHLVK